jgi:outer membrane protein assembly factor BamB
VQSGKDSMLRLLDVDDLSGQAMAGHTGGELALVALPQGGEVLTQPAVWTDASGAVWVFVADLNGLTAIKIAVDAAGAPSLPLPPMNGSWTKPQGGSSPIVVGGILYYAGTAAKRNGTNTVYALEPTTGNVLWSAPLASRIAGAATVGGVHWETPIAVGGRLYVASQNGNTDDNSGLGKGYLTLFTLQ